MSQRTASVVCQPAATFSLILGVTPVALLLMLLALPPIVAEAIARDQQLGVAELRDTLPVSAGLYLIGKVFGVWVSITLMVALVALLSGLFGWARLGGLHFGPYVRIWLTAILPAGLFVSGLSVGRLTWGWNGPRRRYSARFRYRLRLWPGGQTASIMWRFARKSTALRR